MKPVMVNLGFAMARIELGEDSEPQLTICVPEAEGDRPAGSMVIAGQELYSLGLALVQFIEADREGKGFE